jgi:uncharacterized membrane protein YhhN
MIPGLIIVLAVAIVDWIAVAKGWRKVELVAKPLTLVVLLVMLLFGMLEAGSNELKPMILFAAGVFFCLAGDVFLMLSERWFLAGLFAFLLGHVFYILGFNIPLPDVSPFWSFSFAVVLALVSARVLRPIIIAVRQKGKKKLALPIMVYGIVITVMLLSALLTLYREEWITLAAGLATLGASLFYFSDVILAWNKFVTPIKNGRVINMVLYHLGQIALVAGVMMRFTS